MAAAMSKIADEQASAVTSLDEAEGLLSKLSLDRTSSAIQQLPTPAPTTWKTLPEELKLKIMRFCIRFAHTISYGQHVLLSRNADLLNILFTSKEMYRLGKEVYYGSNTFTLRANPSTIFFKRRRMAVTRAMRKLDFSLRIGVGASDLEYLVKLEESGDAAPRDQVPPRKDNEEMLRVSAMAKTHWQKLFPRLTLLRINVTLECCGVGWALGNIGVKEKARVRPRSVEVVVVSEWSRCGGKCKKTVKGVIKSMFRLRTEE